jgi:ankyrin repeat protein
MPKFVTLRNLVKNNDVEGLKKKLQKHGAAAVTLTSREATEFRLTILHIAAALGHDQIVLEILRTKGANPEARDGRGQTPLLLACRNKHTSVVRLLLLPTDHATKHSPSPTRTRSSPSSSSTTTTSSSSTSASSLSASRSGSSGGLGHHHHHQQQQHSGSSSNVVDPELQRKRAKLEKARHEFEEMAKDLARRTINVPDNEGNLPLFYAIRSEQRELFDTIFRVVGIDPSLSNAQNQTALHLIATRPKTVTFIADLLRHSTLQNRIDDVDNNNCTALELAVASGNTEAVRVLLQYGAAIEHPQAATRPISPTPSTSTLTCTSMSAITSMSTNSISSVDSLASSTSSSSTTAPLHWVHSTPSLLVAHSPIRVSVATRSISAQSASSSTLGARALDAALISGARSTHTIPLLIRAVHRDNSDIVSLLLARNATADQVDQHGWTALHHAAKSCKNAAVVTALLDSGHATIDARTDDEQHATALRIALDAAHVELVQTLLRASADIRSIDSHNTSALQLAVQKHHPELVRAVLDRCASMVDFSDAELQAAKHNALQQASDDMAIIFKEPAALKVLQGDTDYHAVVRSWVETHGELDDGSQCIDEFQTAMRLRNHRVVAAMLIVFGDALHTKPIHPYLSSMHAVIDLSTTTTTRVMLTTIARMWRVYQVNLCHNSVTTCYCKRRAPFYVWTIVASHRCQAR